MKLIGSIIITGVMVSVACTSWASDFPNRPITLVVPYAAGGATDLISRTAARLLERELGKPVVVQNKPGANTIVAAQHVASSAPDGYTLVVAGTSSTNVNHYLYKTLPYDIEKDLVPVGMLSRMPYAMLVNSKLDVSTPKELADLAKKQDSQFNYATAGNGNPMHLAALMFELQTGTKMVSVPYKGSAPALIALISHDVQISFDILGTALPYVESGKIKILAVATKERIGSLKNIPTMQESGFTDFVVESGFVVMAPIGTPDDALNKLNAAFNSMLRSPGYREAIESQALIPYQPMTLKEAKEELIREREKWGQIIKTNNITLD